MTEPLKQLSMNERKLIELIFRRGEIARVGLTEATDMTGASVTRLVSNLEKYGLLEEKIDKSGTRGQPKKLLSLRRGSFRAVGIYIYFNRMVGVLIDLDGKTHAVKEYKIEVTQASEIATKVHDISEELLKVTKTPISQFLGTGLSIPGNFGSYGNLVRAHALFSSLDGRQIYDEVNRACPWPVFLENDGTASALGEYLFGGHKNADPLFLIHIGYGLGGGAVVKGRPFRGAHGNACLPGALFPYELPRPSLQDLHATLATEKLSYDAIVSGALGPLADIPVVTQWTQRVSAQLRFAVQVISGMFDPEIIVLGGALPSIILEEIISELRENPPDGPSRGLASAPVTASALGDLSGPVGAASIPFFATFFPGSSLERGNSYLNGRVTNPLQLDD